MGFLSKLSFWRKSKDEVEVVRISPRSPRSPRCPKVSNPEVYARSKSPLEEAATGDLPELPDLPDLEFSSKPTSASTSASSSSSSSRPVDSPTMMQNEEATAVPPQRVKVVCFRDDDAQDHQIRQGSKSKVKLFLAPSQGASQPEEQEDALSFEVPLEDVYRGVSEAFGQMIAASLQSTKWDKRAQALKAITTVLRGLDLQSVAPPGSTGMLGKGLRLRDRARCWRLSCQLMHHVMRDKVMPVRMAAMELFMDTFVNADGALVPQAEAHYALAVLMDHVLDRLGDSNVRLHESAQKCVLLVAERPGLLGLSEVLQRLLSKLQILGKTGEKTKIHFGVIDTVTLLLQHFPARRGANAEKEANCWTASGVTPFILAGMEDDALGPRVRNCACSLAVAVYQMCGSEAMQPLLSALRPAKQALLKQKFEEAEKDLGDSCKDDEDLDDDCDGDARPDLMGLMVCGKSVLKTSSQFGDIKGKSTPIPSLSGQSQDDEEFLMDGILEDTGMVFNGSSITEAVSIPGMCDDLEDFFQIEQELAGLGLDMEGFNEQQALLSSLCDSGVRGHKAVLVY